MSKTVTSISKRELLAYQADVKGSIFRQIRETFSRLKQTGFTQKDLAIKIGMNEGQLSRRLRGDYDLRLETLSDLARGLDCRIDVKLEPISNASVCASESAPGSISKSVWSPEPSALGKYNEMIRRKTLKERHLNESKNFSFKQTKPSPGRCEGHMGSSSRRAFGKRVGEGTFSLNNRNSPIDAKLYALYKK